MKAIWENISFKGKVVCVGEDWASCLTETDEYISVYKKQLPGEVFVGDILVFDNGDISFMAPYHRHGSNRTLVHTT